LSDSQNSPSLVAPSPAGNVNNFVAFVRTYWPSGAFLACVSALTILIIERGFGGTRSLYELRSGAGRLTDDIPLGCPSVKAFGVRRKPDRLRADGLQKSFQRRDPQHQAQSAVAIVR